MTNGFIIILLALSAIRLPSFRPIRRVVCGSHAGQQGNDEVLISLSICEAG
jgi:hypothetical protein